MAIEPTWEEMESVRSERTPATFDDIVDRVRGSAVHYALWNRWLADQGATLRFGAQFIPNWDGVPKPVTIQDARRMWGFLEFCDFTDRAVLERHIESIPVGGWDDNDADLEVVYREELTKKFDAAATELRGALDAAVPTYRDALYAEMQSAVDTRAEQPVDAQTRRAVQERNETTLKNVAEGTRLPFWLCTELLFVGDDHDAATINYWVAYDPPSSQGWLTVRRSRFGAGSVRVTGCEPADQVRFAEFINEFSRKDVRFE